MPPPTRTPAESMLVILCTLCKLLGQLLAQLRGLHDDVEQLLASGSAATDEGEQNVSSERRVNETGSPTIERPRERSRSPRR